MAMIIQPSRFATAGGGAPSSTQWRLFFPAGTATTGLAGGKIELADAAMRATSGGADLCTGGTASASSELSGSYPASQAFDNNTGTLWVTTDGAAAGSWLQYTFGAAVTVEEVTVRNASGFVPTVVYVQYHDGSDWVSYFASDTSAPLSWSVPETKTITNASWAENAGYKRWRLYFDLGASGAGLEILEMQMRAVVSSGLDRCWGGAVSASAVGSSFVAARAVDNNSGTQWWPGDTGTGDWLEYAFFRPETILEVTLSAAAANKGPQTTSVQYYDDDSSTWVTSWQFNATWASGALQTFTKP